MVTTNTCPQCGSPLPAGAADAVCPACLMERGLAGSAASGFVTTVDHGAGVSPALAEQRKSLPQLAAGEQIGEYRIVRPLGHGGMGAVYEAEQTSSGRRIALKLLGHSLDSMDARKRFFREGRLAASVNHPNSVYVYGTEELSGTPAISMELVPGGTLAQRVKERGPLPVAESVDVILQVIAGLEAAQALGVLHRDVKPSNCFLDADGSVKVGDFGLSISTLARGESQLTNSGAFLGTPAFSSPEQLKGEDLDVRSDIYAVGVTLYFLLTGHTPFAADNMVKLLATVLEQPAPSPMKWRADLPESLARVVLRCLEKQPTERYRNYGELRAALQPFSSAMPAPASLPVRFAAGAIDLWACAALGISNMLLLTALGIDPLSMSVFHTTQYWWLFIVGFVINVAYYALPEGIWGASLGKWLCGIRVTRLNRSTPGFAIATLRAAMYVAIPVFPVWVLVGGSRVGTWEIADMHMLLVANLFYPMLALMFATARRRNGYAGLHDLASGTRVIARPRFEERPRLAEIAEAAPAVDSTGAQIGPYHVLEPLGASDDGAEWLLGYDTRLLRKVWIRRLPLGAPALPVSVRNVTRATRLRWNGSQRSATECWDAFEAAAGVPLANLVREPQSWNRVRYWLLDLAQELAAALADGSLPAVLALDRLWITREGRLKLLDFPAPGVAPEAMQVSVPTHDVAVEPAREFLNVVARAALTGNSAVAASPGGPTPPLPLHATQFVEGLPHVQRPEVAVAQLQGLLGKRARVSQRQRWGLLFGCLVFPALCASFMVAGFTYSQQQSELHPEATELMHSLRLMSPLMGQRTSEELEALEVYIGGRFRPLIQDSQQWNSFHIHSRIPVWDRDRAERIVATHPEPTPEEFKEAEAIVRPLLDRQLELDIISKISPVYIAAVVFFSTLFMYVALPAIVAAICFRGGLLLAILGLVGATRTGERASRGRMFGRALLAWLPLLSAPILLAFMTPLMGVAPALGILLVVQAALTVWSLLLPERGLADRLAGTWLVPR